VIDEIEAEIAPKLAAHSDAIQLNPKLFAKVKSLYENRSSLNLNSEDSWLLEKYYRDLVHAGAHLSEAERVQLTGINEELSKLQTAFGNTK
jgi:peptidyl-dipeptidase Dcp